MYSKHMSLSREVLQFLVLFLSITLAGCGGGGGESAEPSLQRIRFGDFTVVSPSATVKPHYDDLIHVTAEVNGTQGHFILDSGADAFLVSPEFAARAGLPVSGTTTIHTIVGSSEVQLRRITSFRFANIVGADIDAAEATLHGIDGIIGLPLFKVAILELDYVAGTLRIFDPAVHSLDAIKAQIGGEILHAPNFVVEDVTVNGQAVGPMRIDTGTGGGFRVAGPAGLALLNEAPDSLEVHSTAANGSVDGAAFIADEASFHNFSLQEQFIIVQERELEAGLIGSLVLRQFLVVMDMGEDELLLRHDRQLEFDLHSALN